MRRHPTRWQTRLLVSVIPQTRCGLFQMITIERWFQIEPNKFKAKGFPRIFWTTEAGSCLSLAVITSKLLKERLLSTGVKGHHRVPVQGSFLLKNLRRCKTLLNTRYVGPTQPIVPRTGRHIRDTVYEERFLKQELRVKARKNAEITSLDEV